VLFVCQNNIQQKKCGNDSNKPMPHFGNNAFLESNEKVQRIA
jgi:hypothetical protein